MSRPPTFDVQTVERAGLALVADEGWAAVSVRAVAARLGVSTMALYRVAPDAHTLRRTIADAAAEPIQPRRQPSDDVVDALGQWAPRAYRQLARHPGLAAFVVTEWTELPRWLDIVERLLAMAADGRRAGDAVAVVNAVFAFVLARAQFADAIHAAGPRRLTPVDADPGRYPEIRRRRPAFAVARTSPHFQIGLDALLRGLGDGTDEARLSG
jgi:AcrR family transcriptional regulator